LRRIYAQLEAGIVELRPKTMPDVPVMSPQGGGGDFTFGGNAGQAPTQAPNWPNGQQASPPRQAPAPRAPSPQAPWPAAAPQFPQTAAPGGMPRQAPQAPNWPNGPQSAQPQARPPQPPQPMAPQPPAYQPPPGYPQAPQAYRPEPTAPEAEDAFMGEPELEPEPKKKKPALLKWGIGALVASVVLVGLWLALGDSSGPSTSSGSFDTSDPVLDPDDPRSRKADRLPNNF
jgi:hypothetical protein